MRRRQFLKVAGAAMAGVTIANATGQHLFAAGGEGGELEYTAAQYTKMRRYMPTRFGRIAYLDEGEGDAVLLLHGFPLNNFQWRGVIPRLAGSRRCLAPDFLGLGYSEVTEGQGVTPFDQVEMLAAFLDELGVSSVDLIANDSGGAVAQIFAVRYPSRVRSILFTNCDVEPDSPPPALEPVIEMAREGTYPDMWLVPWLNDKDLARSKDGLGGFCYSKPGHPTDEAIDMYLSPLVESEARKALTNAYTLGLTPNPLAGIEAELRRLEMPVRIIWGMADDIFAKESPDYLNHVMQNSRGIRRLESAKLFFPEEYPEVIAEEALKLWQL
ncbi:alpha/beta fold hydrolase [Kordiimonas sp.]|uniref:alpha/beta fold hydrolase n=1 Tax=Kordiimonas sp. TaxID=1970157 RepID=UPI003A8F0589